MLSTDLWRRATKDELEMYETPVFHGCGARVVKRRDGTIHCSPCNVTWPNWVASLVSKSPHFSVELWVAK